MSYWFWAHWLELLVCVIGMSVLVAVVSRDADCYWCTPTFCAFDQDCPQNCSCCIEEGAITGECC
jgi:hypothetical protein